MCWFREIQVWYVESVCMVCSVCAWHSTTWSNPPPSLQRGDIPGEFKEFLPFLQSSLLLTMTEWPEFENFSVFPIKKIRYGVFLVPAISVCVYVCVCAYIYICTVTYCWSSQVIPVSHILSNIFMLLPRPFCMCAPHSIMYYNCTNYVNVMVASVAWWFYVFI